MSPIIRSFLLLLSALSVTECQDQQKRLFLQPSGPKTFKSLGSTIDIRCIGGNPNVTYWLDPMKSRITPETHKRMDLTVVKTQPSLILSIFDITADDKGVYKCVSMFDGEEVTESITLVTYKRIRFVDGKEEQQAISGKDYKLVCKVESDPRSYVSWHIFDSSGNRQTITETDNKYIIEADGLIIKNVAESDERRYMCKASMESDPNDSDHAYIFLQVVVPPKIDPTMKSVQEVVEGSSADIVCSASGKPLPLISWIRSSNQENVSSVNGVHHFDKITKEDDGAFKCVASNVGDIDERTIHLKVLRKPDIISVKNATVTEGNSADIKCIVTGYPQPAVSIRRKWAMNNEAVVPSADNRTVVVNGTYENAEVTIATLNFERATRNDSGIYDCVASNSIGKHEESLQLEVQFVPIIDKSNPYLNESITWDQKPVNCTCVVEANPNATVEWFFNSKSIQQDSRYVRYANPPYYSLEVVPKSYTDYGEYKCCARNTIGENCHQINLREGRRPSPVEKAIFDSTATTINFKFVGPMDTGYLPIKAYIVLYKKENENWNVAQNKTWPAGEKALYTLTNLIPLTTYNFKFAASNEAGNSDWGAESEWKMPERSIPNEPTISNPITQGQNYIEVTNKEFELKWIIPADNGVPIDGYQLKYCVVTQAGDTYLDKNPPECSVTKITQPSASAYALTDLQPNNYYKVELSAHNNIGSGKLCIRYLKTGSMIQDKSTIEELGLSNAVIIYIVIAVLIALLVIIDLSCFMIGNTGLLYTLFKCCFGKKKPNEEKLGSEGKDLISNGHGKKPEEESMLINNGSGKKDLAVEYDVKKGTAKTGFIGKDSAV